MNHAKSEGFTTTNWSLILAAMDTAPASASSAMERLCTRYWFPVYASIRRHGNDVHQAEDLTQGFFEFVIEHRVVQQAKQEKGRFRNFILSSLNNFLHNHHDRATAAKRGGRHQIVPMDDANAEEILASEPAYTSANVDSFDRSWAVTLIRRVMENLLAEFAERGRSAVYEAFQPYLSGEPLPGDYDRVAVKLSMETGTVRVALHRFRRRFGELLRSEVAYTVADPDEVEDEIRYLLSVLGEQ